MKANATHISESIEILNRNLIDIGQVGEWADLMGYKSAKKFSRRFLRHYSVRPRKVLVYIRLKSIYKYLCASQLSNFEIARKHSLPDGKALNKYVNYHLSCSPSDLQLMKKEHFQKKLQKFSSKLKSFGNGETKFC